MPLTPRGGSCSLRGPMDPAALQSKRRAVVTIGNFDGVHRGHAALLSRIVERARAADADAVVVTFEPHPVAVLAPERAPRRIYPADMKRARLLAAGIGRVLELSFDRALAAQTATAFVDDGAGKSRRRRARPFPSRSPPR